MSRTHDHHEAIWGKRLIATMILNIVIPAVQVYGGIVSGSMALISDALHNFSDFTAVLISYLALRVGKRGPSLTQTYGYRRVEVLAALLNVAVLYGVSIYMAIEAGKRLYHPHIISGQTVIWIAMIAVAANVFSTFLLRSGAKINLNLRGAFLHMLIDSLVSLGVLVMGVIWIFRPWYWLDPLVTWVIVAFVLFSGWDILRTSALVLMNSAPSFVDLKAIQKEVEALSGVECMHHLHVWSLDVEGTALTAHIMVTDQMLSQVDDLADRIRTILSEKFHIDHPVLQFETRSSDATPFLCDFDDHI